MKAAVLTELGSPRFGDFEDPVAGASSVVVEVAAAGINHVDLAKAAGAFYTGPPPLPSVVGSDGVGRLADGTRVYFDGSVRPFGALAESTLVDPLATFPIHADGVTDLQAAALGNAGIAAVQAVKRARPQPGDRVLVLGASGTVGSIAVQLCLLGGAAAVVAVGRDAARLASLRAIGAVPLELGGEGSDLTDAILVAAGGPVDVIVDPVWGEPALAAMRAAAQGARLVQLGQRAGGSIELPASLLRSKRMELIGISGALDGHEARAAAYAEVIALAAEGKLSVAVERVRLREIEHAWVRQASGARAKLIVVP